MTLRLTPDLEKQIESRLQAGKYQSAEDVIEAALRSLAQDEARGDFAPNEWDALLAEGEASGPPLDGDAVFARLRSLGKDTGPQE